MRLYLVELGKLDVLALSGSGVFCWSYLGLRAVWNAVMAHLVHQPKALAPFRCTIEKANC